MKKRNLALNMMVLSLVSIITRGSGMILKIYLSGEIGEYGMGLYSLVLTIYMLGIVFGSAGMSAGVSKLAAECLSTKTTRDFKRLNRVASTACLVLGLCAGAGFFAFGSLLSQTIVGSSETTLSVQILALGMPAVSLSSALKGFLYAMGKAKKTSLSFFIEQMVKIVFIIIVLEVSDGLSVIQKLEGISAGIVAGEVVSFLFLFVIFKASLKKLEGNKSDHTKSQLLRKLGALVIPAALSSYLISGFRAIENMIIPNKIEEYGASREQAISTYGVLKGMVMPILMFPSVIITSLSVLMVPEISSCMISGNMKKAERLFSTSIKYTCAMSVIIGALFFVFADLLGTALYSSDAAGVMIRQLSVICPFIYIEMVCDGMLAGLGQQMAKLRYNFIDSSLRLILIFSAVPFFGVAGLVWTLIFSNIFTSVLSLRRLVKVTGLKINYFATIVKPLTYAVISVSVGSFASTLIDTKIAALVTGGIVSVVLFLALLLVTGFISKEELSGAKVILKTRGKSTR